MAPNGSAWPMIGTSRLLPLAAAAIALVLSTAACGSSSNNSATTSTSSTTSDATASTTWANSACTAFVNWRASVTAAGKSVSANPTKETVDQALASAKQATTKLKTTLKALPAPTTSAGTQARQELQQLKGQLQNDVVVIQRTVASVPAGSTGASQAASMVQTGLATMRQQIAAAGKELRSLPSGEGAQAFNDAPACKSL